MPDVIKDYHRVVSAALEPWAIDPRALPVVASVIARILSGDPIDYDAIDRERAEALARRGGEPAPSFSMENGIAMIPIHGVLAPRSNMFSEVSGSSTFDVLQSHVEAALAARVKAIVFDVNSPGGSATGATEFADVVRQARARVPVISQVHGLCCSAAYWPVANSTQIVATPSSMVGAIGVYTVHEDVSAALDKAGRKRTVISAGKYKAEGIDGGPLSEEATAHVRDLVTKIYGRFIGDVAHGRGVTPEAVQAGYGEGRALLAADALTAGLIDRVGTLGDTLTRLAAPAAVASLPAAPTRADATAQERFGATAQEHTAIVAEQLAWTRRLMEVEYR